MSKLAAFIKEHDIKYVLFNFTDIRGVQRSKLVPASAAPGMEEGGAGFAGFAADLDLSPSRPDILAVPDTDTVIQLPWQREVAWVACDLWLDGEPIEQSPRRVLKRLLEQAANQGLYPKSGVEAEFHIINEEGDGLADSRDTAAKPCYDQSILLRQYDIISEVCDAMHELGWGPYQNDHEDSNGQFEMNWEFSDALTTADRHVFFKFMLKSIAEKHGRRVTFMPKPFIDLTGNGCHVHMSLWDKPGDGKGRNLLPDPKGREGLSAMAHHFLGGTLHHAPAMCAVTNPAINSYKRLNAPVTASGATWSPNSITWGGDNRTLMVRAPDPERFEFRQADGAANPYLLQAVTLAAGLAGIEAGRDSGKVTDIDMYAEGHKARGVRKLPLYLIDAIRSYDRDKALKSLMGDEFSAAYVKLKTHEWNDYSRHLTSWEREHTLDC